MSKVVKASKLSDYTNYFFSGNNYPEIKYNCFRLAYKKLIRMNMPVDEAGKVNFTTTLFALIRENLNIKVKKWNPGVRYSNNRNTYRIIFWGAGKKVINSTTCCSPTTAENHV